jgi:hypothetical protein
MNILLGVDPGTNGGFMARFPSGTFLTGPLPDTEGDLLALLEMVAMSDSNEKICYLENLVKFTGSPMPSSAMASYASNWGVLKGMLMALKFQLVLVTPQTWQKALGLGSSKGLSKTEWKNKLKSEAQRLFPSQKITLANADAALIFRHADLQERKL